MKDEYPIEQLKNLPEKVIRSVRKYYSIGDLTMYNQFRHLEVTNYYNQKKVC